MTKSIKQIHTDIKVNKIENRFFWKIKKNSEQKRNKRNKNKIKGKAEN